MNNLDQRIEQEKMRDEIKRTLENHLREWTHARVAARQQPERQAQAEGAQTALFEALEAIDKLGIVD